jgi:hypothetical protein
MKKEKLMVCAAAEHKCFAGACSHYWKHKKRKACNNGRCKSIPTAICVRVEPYKGKRLPL